MYIYRTFNLDTRYIPPREVNRKEWPTQKEAIDYLVQNGGGWFRNIMANFDCYIHSQEEIERIEKMRGGE